MAFFIDSIDLDEIRSAAKLGLFSGVTTNPKLFSKIARSEMLDHLAKIAAVSQGSIYVQVDLEDIQQMERQALTMMEVAPGRIVIKCSASLQAFELCYRLRPHRLPVCVTAVFSSLQAAAAATAKAHAVAMYTGRISDFGGDGIDTIANTAKILSSMRSSTRLLAASIKDQHTLEQLLQIPGIDVTIPGFLLESLWQHQGTKKAISEFRTAAEESKALGDYEEEDSAVLRMLEDDPT